MIGRAATCAQAPIPVTNMKVKYFSDTDTLYIEFRDRDIAESTDLDENTTLDVDGRGNICAITFEHAMEECLKASGIRTDK